MKENEKIIETNEYIFNKRMNEWMNEEKNELNELCKM